MWIKSDQSEGPENDPYTVLQKQEEFLLLFLPDW